MLMYHMITCIFMCVNIYLVSKKVKILSILHVYIHQDFYENNNTIDYHPIVVKIIYSYKNPSRIIYKKIHIFIIIIFCTTYLCC
jgi:hypothetical protein